MGFVLCDLGKVKERNAKFLLFFFFFLYENRFFIKVSPCGSAGKMLKCLDSPQKKIEEFGVSPAAHSLKIFEC